MFLSDLTEEQKITFYNIAMDLVYSDEILDINEAQLIARLEKEMGLSNKDIPKNKDLQSFDTKKSKSIAILELLMIAYIDEDFNVEESNYIKKIADFLEVNSMDFTEMKWWVKKKIEHDKEALKFFK